MITLFFIFSSNKVIICYRSYQHTKHYDTVEHLPMPRGNDISSNFNVFFRLKNQGGKNNYGSV